MPTIVETHIHHGIVRTIYDDDTYKDHFDHEDGDFYPLLQVLTPHGYSDNLTGINITLIEFTYNGDLNNLAYTIDGGSASSHDGTGKLRLQNLTVGLHTLVFSDSNYPGTTWSHQFVVRDGSLAPIKWKLQFDDIDGNPVFVNIRNIGYAGAEIEICGTGSPLKIEWDDEDKDFLKPIRGARASLSLRAQTDNQFADLVNADDGTYFLEVTKGSPATPLFYGVIQSEGLSQTYKAPGQQTYKIIAVDQLAFLKNKQMTDRLGRNYNHTSINLTDFIRRVFMEVDEMYFIQQPKLYVFNSIRPAGTSTTPSTNEMRLDLNRFFDAKGEAKSVYEILEMVLASAKLQLMKVGTDLYLRSVEKYTGNVPFYYLTTGLIPGITENWILSNQDLTKTLDGIGNGADHDYIDNAGSYRWKQPAGRVETKFNYQKNPEVVINPTKEEAWDDGTLQQWQGNATIEEFPYYENPLNTGERINFNQGSYPIIRDKNVQATYDLATTDPHIKSKVIKVKKSDIQGKRLLFKIQWEILNLSDVVPVYRVYYEILVGPLSFKKNGEWQGHSIHNSTGTDIETIAQWVNSQDSVTGERLTEPIDFGIANLDGTYNHVEEVDVMVRVWGLYVDTAADALEVDGIYIKELSLQFIDGDDDKKDDLTVVDNNSGKRRRLENEVEFGSTEELKGLPHCVENQFLDAKGYPIHSWTKSSEGSDLSTGGLINNLGDAIAAQHSAARATFNASAKGTIFPHYQITFEGQQFMIQSLSLDVKRNSASFKLMELHDTIV
ncbi:MAG: hypothetical protein MK081_13910 [Flavobacteriales bacterium]|nr:hypothetical protein [Flavobacteriales bacterium]